MLRLAGLGLEAGDEGGEGVDYAKGGSAVVDGAGDGRVVDGGGRGVAVCGYEYVDAAE